eukprot:UN07084
MCFQNISGSRRAMGTVENAFEISNIILCNGETIGKQKWKT